MITSKQKWFLEKLMNEIEKLGLENICLKTRYADVQFDSYRMRKSDASKDIEMLLNVKEQLLKGTKPSEIVYC